MSLFMFKGFSAFITFLVAIAGGVLPFLKKTAINQSLNGLAEFDFPIGESFASGIFLGAGLLHMLPDAAQNFFKAGYNYPLPFLIAALGFLTLLFLEHIGYKINQRIGSLFSSIALLTLLMLSIHSLLEGAAVGLANNLITSFIIFIAIVAHRGAASFALSINLNRSQLSTLTAWLAFGIFAVMTPLGIFAGSWISSGTQSHPLLTPIFTALAAGTFLYIGTLHGFDRASLIRHCGNFKEFIAMLIGFGVMAIVAIWT